MLHSSASTSFCLSFMPIIAKNLLTSPSGFIDFPPPIAKTLEHFLQIIRKHYELHGFIPIETPLVERSEILTAKASGEITNQMYGLRLLNPHPKATDDSKDLALRFDHTIPLARFVCAHLREIKFPFRRYAIGPVFRGEKAKEGRYRQFIQADIDTIGEGELNLAHDAEFVSIISGIFHELNIGPFTIRIGHRKLLNAYFSYLGIPNDNHPQILQAIDKLEKIGQKEVRSLLSKLHLSNSQIDKLLSLLMTSGRDAAHYLDSLKHVATEIGESFTQGVLELRLILQCIQSLRVPESCYAFDLTIARGLDYYTGVVFETRLNNYPELGSIASGGRYDNLTEVYMDKKMPGVGISIGVTRLLLRLLKAGLLPESLGATANMFVTTAESDPSYLTHYLAYAHELREYGIPTEIYLQPKSLAKQLEYAHKRGFTYALIATAKHLKENKLAIRHLPSGRQKELAHHQLMEALNSF
ncbi:MAG: histidine--tRNA ligase [Gammaproteobacteria bacterium]|nr:histidine--tRNA ligase [Gammaproteobacteria bacterium]